MTNHDTSYSADLNVGKEALNSFIESHPIFSKFVPLEVILEIRWSKPMPIDHGSFYRGAILSWDSMSADDSEFQPRRASVFCERGYDSVRASGPNGVGFSVVRRQSRSCA